MSKLWLGNKNAIPRIPGARMAKRASQVATSGYTLKQLFQGLKLPKVKAVKVKF